MIVETFKQRTAAWHKARLGIPSASNFEKILSPKQRKASTQAEGYMMQLLAEWLIGVPHDAGVSAFMDRGTQMEPEAIRWYEYERGLKTSSVGLVLRDDRMVACSPDCLVGEDGGLEVKCPAASTHVYYLLKGLEGYHGQVQGALWLTGRKWWDLLSYHPDLPPVLVRVVRDEEYIAALGPALDTFVSHLQLSREALLRMGCKPATRLHLVAGQGEAEPF